MFRSGDVVYFKTAQNSSRRKSNGATFKGYGIGLFIGHVTPFGKDPSPTELLKLVGACGYLSFDDVADFLGDEQAQKCVQAYEKKYYSQEPEVKDESGNSLLVDKHGHQLKGPERQLLKMPTKPLKPGETIPVLTLADVQKQLKAMTPDQVRDAIKNAKVSAQSQLGRGLSDEEIKQIDAKVCGAMGVDPAIVLKDEGGEIFPKSKLPVSE